MIAKSKVTKSTLLTAFGNNAIYCFFHFPIWLDDLSKSNIF